MKNVWVVSWVLALGVAGAAQARQQAAPPSLAASRAVLTSGVIVDLLGVSEESGPGALWWTVEGKPLARPPVALSARGPLASLRGTRTMLLLVRLTPPGFESPQLRQVTAEWQGGAKLAPQVFGIAAVKSAPGVSLLRFSAPETTRGGVFRLSVSLYGDRSEVAEFKSVSLRPAPR
jgi:hypothetical protein